MNRRCFSSRIAESLRYRRSRVRKDVDMLSDVVEFDRISFVGLTLWRDLVFQPSLAKAATPLVLVFAVLSSLPAFGAGVPRSIDATVQEFVRKAGFNDRTPGIAVIANRDKASFYQNYIGMANLKTGQMIGANTPFRLASVSKPFTALAVTQLAEKGRVQFNDPVKKHLPTFPWGNVTVHQLLTHTAGTPEYTSFNFLRPNPTNLDILQALNGKRLRFEPGTSMRYSNTGYAVLASLVESTGKVPFPVYLKKNVFDRSKMGTAAVPGLNWERVPNRAVGYTRKARVYFEFDRDTFNGVAGDGGIFASPSDVDRWLTAYHSAKLCSKNTLTRATRPNVIKNKSHAYGYGWCIDRFSGDTIVWHDGSWVGFNTFAARLVNQKANIVILSNSDVSDRKLDLVDLGFSIAAWFLANPVR